MPGANKMAAAATLIVNLVILVPVERPESAAARPSADSVVRRCFIVFLQVRFFFDIIFP
jgi:hypothetical protein